jgi:dipeptidyl aminopeptidase/acylaminoacyl peptidase
MVAVSVRSPQRAGSWIEVMTLAGRNRVRVTRPNVRAHDRSPVWSPDGGRLAFVRDAPVGSAVYTREVGGTLRMRIPLRRDVARFPPLLAWSRAGAALVTNRWHNADCTLRRPFRHRLAIANLRARTLREIRLLGSARTHTYVGDYDLSPDGRRLIYLIAEAGDPEPGGDPGCRFHRDPSDLYVVSAAGRERRRLVEGEVVAAYWSPRGQKIAYRDCSDAVASPCDLFVLRLADGQRREFTDISGNVVWISETELAVNDGETVVVVNDETGAERTLTTLPSSGVTTRIISSDRRTMAVVDQATVRLLRIRVLDLAGSTVGTFQLRPRAGELFQRFDFDVWLR